VLAASPTALSEGLAAERAGIPVAMVHTTVGENRKEEFRQI